VNITPAGRAWGERAAAETAGRTVERGHAEIQARKNVGERRVIMLRDLPVFLEGDYTFASLHLQRGTVRKLPVSLNDSSD
jgi:hypothetical protein